MVPWARSPQYENITLCGQTKHALRMRVCSTSTTVTSRQGIILMLSANVDVKSTSASAFGLESSVTLPWAPICCLIGWLLNDIVIFWKLFYRGCLEVCLCLWGRRCGSSSSSALWGRCRAVVQHDISRKVVWTSGAECIASSVAGSNPVEFFPMRTPEEAHLCSPLQDYRRSRSKTSSSCDNCRCQDVKTCSRECRVAQVCLEMDGGCFEHIF
jgi:hypothetical protein